MSILMRPARYLPMFLLLVLPFTLGAGPAPNGNYAKNRQIIESMSQPQRDRLSRNFESYKELTPDEKEYYRQLHQQVEDDAIERPVKNLKESMENYIEWLNTIDPYDRQRIREESDMNKRMQIIRQILISDARKLRDVKLAIAAYIKGKSFKRDSNPPPLEQFNKFTRAIVQGLSLSREDLSAVMKVFESDVPMSELGKSDLKELEGVRKYAYLLREAIVYGSQKNGLEDGSPILKKIESSISDPYIRNIVFNSKTSNDSRRRILGGMLLRSIYHEDISNKIEEEPISEAELAAVLKESKNEVVRRMQNVHPELLSDPGVQKELLEWGVGVRKFDSSSILTDISFLRTLLPQLRMSPKERGGRMKNRGRPGGGQGGGPGKGPKGKRRPLEEQS